MIVPWCLFPSHVSWNRSAREPWKKETHDFYTLHTTGEKLNIEKDTVDGRNPAPPGMIKTL